MRGLDLIELAGGAEHVITVADFAGSREVGRTSREQLKLAFPDGIRPDSA